MQQSLCVGYRVFLVRYDSGRFSFEKANNNLHFYEHHIVYNFLSSRISFNNWQRQILYFLPHLRNCLISLPIPNQGVS